MAARSRRDTAEMLATIRTSLDKRKSEREDRSFRADRPSPDGPQEFVPLETLSDELRDKRGMSNFLRKAQIIRDRKANEQVPDVNGHGTTTKKASGFRDSARARARC